MENVIIGFCPYCGGEGLVCPAREEGSAKIVFVCGECLAVFESLEDYRNAKSRALRTRYTVLTMEQAMKAGLSHCLMRFNGKRWIPTEESNAPGDAEKTLHEKGLRVIREYLAGSPENVIDAVIKSIEKYDDIVLAFSSRILTGTEASGGVTVRVGEEEFSADSLMRDHQRIASLQDAYSFLAFLRDDPVSAVGLLKRGLPVK